MIWGEFGSFTDSSLLLTAVVDLKNHDREVGWGEYFCWLIRLNSFSVINSVIDAGTWGEYDSFRFLTVVYLRWVVNDRFMWSHLIRWDSFINRVLRRKNAWIFDKQKIIIIIFWFPRTLHCTLDYTYRVNSDSRRLIREDSFFDDDDSFIQRILFLSGEWISSLRNSFFMNTRDNAPLRGRTKYQRNKNYSGSVKLKNINLHSFFDFANP